MIALKTNKCQEIKKLNEISAFRHLDSNNKAQI